MSKLYKTTDFKAKVRLTAILFLLLPTMLFAQNLKFKFPVGKPIPVSELIKSIKNQTNYSFYYRSDVFNDTRNVTISKSDLSFEEAMKIILGNDFKYSKENNKIAISKKENTPQSIKKEASRFQFKGTILDKESKQPIIGATILLENGANGAISDSKGNFSLFVEAGTKMTISFIGFEDISYLIGDVKEKVFTMKSSTMAVEEVIVTGIYTRKKESFTGSAATYTGSDLKMIGTQNVLQSLKTIDPSFVMLENNQFGSDPNRLPDIEIRGKSSMIGMKDAFATDPNQPLFILDGFETTLQVITDLPMDRVASLTILKDAASTAIYGAKAANGVVVVETKAPARGKLRVSYNGNAEISVADLSDYNLMNSTEKLEYERLAGRFNSEIQTTDATLKERYNRLKAEIDRGVDTYWMSEPLRIGFNHRHNLYAEGGDDQMRYGLGAGYRNTQGVMKESNRNIFNGNVDLTYRVKNISFSNKFSLEVTTTSDPIVAFSQYSRTNPYYRKYDDAGQAPRWLEQDPSDPIAGLDNNKKGDYDASNPLWNDGLNSFKQGNQLSFRNYFNIEWAILPYLKAAGRFGISVNQSENENFLSAEDTSFESIETLLRGSYANNTSKGNSYDGDISVSFGKAFAEKHVVNFVVGTQFRSSKSNYKGYVGAGFPTGNFTKPSFANSYAKDGKPSYGESLSRSTSQFVNAGYSYDNRYMADFNLRSDGSSIFGTNRRFTTTWSVGLAWNLHNEPFMKDLRGVFNNVKIRGSVGNPGNQNFGGAQTFTSFVFNNWMLNSFGAGLSINGFGNPDLDWQKTLDQNIGLDLSLFSNKVTINFDAYNKITDPMLALITIPSSTGATMNGKTQMISNFGEQREKGITSTIGYRVLYNPAIRKNYTISLSLRTGNGTYENIGNRLEQFNVDNRKNASLMRYYDGASTTALWAVPSAGIDPASGRELMIDTNGKYVFKFDEANQVVVGNQRPTIEGVFGNNFMYKGFSVSLYIRYSYGADVLNEALYNKVENISESSMKSNQDKRALTDRWIKPGDIAKFKGISLTDETKMTSRFIEKNNYISFESIRIGYEFSSEALKSIGFRSLSLNGYMNDLFRISSIKRERGIDYPFARTVTFSLSATF